MTTMALYQELIDCYIHGIVRRRSRGISMSGLEMFTFIRCRNKIEQELKTPEWLKMGIDGQVLSILMQTGDELLTKGQVGSAMDFYREASYLFPHCSMCFIREAQCQVRDKSFDQAKKACMKAIPFSNEGEIEELLAILDIFMGNDRLPEAYEVCLTMMDRFPQKYNVQRKVKDIEILFGDKAAAEKTIGKKKKTKLDEASGGTDQSAKSDIAQNTASVKVVKTTKQLRKEQIKKDKAIEREIEKAKKVQEEKEKEILRKQEEERRKKEQDESVEKLRKLDEVEARERREREEKLEKKKNDDIKKQQAKKNKSIRKRSSKSSDSDKDMNLLTSDATRTKKASSANRVLPKKDKTSLNDMPMDLDHVFSTGSRLRRVCPTCNTPRVFSKGMHRCHSCTSELLIWYQKTNTSIWTKPRKPPTNVFGAYAQCKHFQQSKMCAKAPCNFAHGEEEVEIWELCRSIGAMQQAQRETSATLGQEKQKRPGNRRSREHKTSASTLQKYVSSMSNTLDMTTDTSDDWTTVRQPKNAQTDASTSDALDVDSSSQSNETSISNTLNMIAEPCDDWTTVGLPKNAQTDASTPNAPDSSSQSSETSISNTLDMITDPSDDVWTTVRLPNNAQTDASTSDVLDVDSSSQSNQTAMANTPALKTDTTDDGWTTVGQRKTHHTNVAKSSYSRNAIQISCSLCKSTISTAKEPEVIKESQMCKVCNKKQKPDQVYWNEHSRALVIIRDKPDGVRNVQMCRHFLRDNVHLLLECKFAHGEYEKILWKKELNGGKKKNNGNSVSTNTSCEFPISQFLRCTFCGFTSSSQLQLEHHYSDAHHKVNVMKRAQPLLRQQLNASKCRPHPDGVYMGRYKLCHRFEQGQHFTQLRSQRVLTDSFSEEVRRRVQHEGHQVLKENLPGVTVICSSSLRVKLEGGLEGPQDHMWIFNVRIQTKDQLLLRQVAFLLETHLDKFRFLRTPSRTDFLNMQSVRLLEEDFVEDSTKHESAVQFCVQFSSSVFGDFEQTLVFDFGQGSVLARSLFVSVVSKDIYGSKEDTAPRSTYCRILEWSVEKMELILCKDLMQMDLEGLCEQYSIPDVLPNPGEILEFTRETYCTLWHDILFIEEQHIQSEVARYDIRKGAMTVMNSFKSAQETVFAMPGEWFGEIYLSDYLVMDEVAGHLISRSVMSVILRIRDEDSQRVYECSIKLRTNQSVIIKLNEVLCEDYCFEKGQVISIDLKFRYNRLPMCEMHQAIDMCEQKTEVLLPNVKNVSYKYKKKVSDWFMERKPNANQHEAISMILDPNTTPPILVIGPFGTGKTFTLSLACVEILRQLQRNKVLICTHSNSAANIHLEYLHDKIQAGTTVKIQPLRILNVSGKLQSVDEKLRRYCLIKDGNVIREPTWDEIRDRNVIITTLATSRMLWKFFKNGSGLRFTHILIDEAAQALEPECVTPLVIADGKTKIVLAGDHQQMGPPAYSKGLWTEDFSPEQSLLERLFTHYQQHNKSATKPSSSSDNETPYLVWLTENYRHHAEILKFSSECFYGGELVAKGDQSTHKCVPVLSFYAVQGVDKQVEGSLGYYNDAEVAEIVKRVERLVFLSPENPAKNIGVLTPYREQVQRIRLGLRKNGLGDVNVEKVENVQGKVFKALFISTVRTMHTCWIIEGRKAQPGELDFAFLSNPRFLNTAVTRAQSLLAVVGDPMSLCSVGTCSNLWKDYLQRCEANKGLYGCTLKTVKDFCLRSQALDPSAHEFTPCSTTVADEKEKTVSSTSSKVEVNIVSVDENVIESTSRVSESELDKGSASTSGDFTPPAMADPSIQPASRSIVDGQDFGGVEGIQADKEDDLAADNDTDRDENATAEEEKEGEDESEMNQFATDNFSQREVDDFDKIIEELIKACPKTKKKDEIREQKAINTNEDFPPLNAVVPSTSAPQWQNISFNRTFSAGLRDGRIELGFHVKESERLFRLTGGKLAPKGTGHHYSSNDIVEAYKPEELLKLLKENPTVFTKCTFRIDSGNGQRNYIGQLPAPESSDVHILGQVRGVYEDDVVVVLELQPSAKWQDEQEKEENKVFGYIKGVLRRLIGPEERQFVCTVDKTNPGVMLPMSKNSPKLMNFTKTDEENIIPIYKMKNNQVERADILEKNLYAEALAGERVFVVKYLKWRTDCPYPLGLAIRHIPHGRDFKTGMEILYEEHNVKREFNAQVRTLVKRDFKSAEDWQVPASERGRPVYRDNVFTIDPPESKDLDDAISIRSLGNGNYELHVHIADVSYFVRPNTTLDEVARLRGTSYYPPKPDKNVPMLPRELSEGCCSLLQGKDRLAVTVVVEVTPDGTVVGDARMERSLVRSCSRLTYHEAQQIINEARSQTGCLAQQKEVLTHGSDGNCQQADLPEEPENDEIHNKKEARCEGKQIPNSVKETIGVIHRIAEGRRRSRLGFERSLYHRKGDDDDDDQDAHEMIEEIMIMANHLVAKHLLKKFPNSTPLRVQPPPKTKRVVEWKQRFQKYLKFSLGLDSLGLRDAEIVQEGKIDLKVPYKTWIMIVNQLEANQGSNFQELVNLVCDLDLFPQLALANVAQQRLQQRGQYMCSGETFEIVPVPWAQLEKEDKQNVHCEASSNAPPDLSEDNEKLSENTTDHDTESGNVKGSTEDDIPTTSRSSVNEGPHCSTDGLTQCSAEDSQCNERDLNNILRGHSSLCLDAYCHFTSPIRRYIDIVVHRLVVATIEDRENPVDPDDIATVCDRCTFLARNASRFDKDAKKLQLAVNVQSSLKFVSALIDEIASDSLKLFFGPGEFELLSGTSVRIARLGPDKEPVAEGGSVTLQWTFRFLRLDKKGIAQSALHISDEEDTQVLAETLESQAADDEEESNTSELSDDDFDLTVSGEHWNRVLEAVKNQDEDQLRTRLQQVDKVVQEQRKPESSTKISLLKRIVNDPSESTSAPYQHPNAKKGESSEKGTYEKETDEFLRVTRSFGSCDQVKVQMCSQITRGILSPTIQLFKITDKIHACVEHRNSPTTCFAKYSHKRPNKANIPDITEYVNLWKPVLMMKIATSAICGDDVITLSNLRVSFVQENGEMRMEFDLSEVFCENHVLEPLGLNLMCVRVKDPKVSGKDAGYWVGHFQISEELRIKENAKNLNKAPKKKANAKEFRPVLARLIHSASLVPDWLISQRFCYVTVELIVLSIPDRRCLEALHNSVLGSKLVKDICTGQVSMEVDADGSSLPSRDLSLCNEHPTLQNFYPLNKYQCSAVEKALTKQFTLIQGPPGTGKTVTGVHIAYWFAQVNKKRIPTVGEDGEECKGSMVFYCGPSNKSVDVVARYLMKIPGVKILRIYGQEIERKEFPVPDKVTLFRSKRVAVQLKADKELADVSLHHVIRSEKCEFAEDLKEYDRKFKEYMKHSVNVTPEELSEFNEIKSAAEEWAITQSGVDVILATCISAYSPRVMSPCWGFFCQCIIDECGMCIEAETLCAMLGSDAKRVVLIGDHKQLQPVIQCDKAKDLGLGISMFERYSKWSQMLEIQYRMPEELCKFPSEFFYDGKLKTANQVRGRPPDNVDWPNGSRYPFVFHHVDGIEESLVVSTDQGNENSKKNKKEIAKVVDVARRLTNKGIKGADIVVLSPYRAQCFEITEKLKQHGMSDISVMSVVAAQGSEKSYVILSLVRSLPEREIERNPTRSWLTKNLGFITDEHQINVALTRAKRGLCIIGNANLIGVCRMWRKLLEHYEKKGCLQKDI